MREFLSPHNVPFYWEDQFKRGRWVHSICLVIAFGCWQRKIFMSFTTTQFIQWERFRCKSNATNSDKNALSSALQYFIKRILNLSVPRPH